MDWAHGTPMMVGPYLMGWAEPSPETVEYWKGVEQNRLLLKRCRGCGKHHHPRRMFCYLCTSDELEWVESPGRGEVFTYSTVHRGPTEILQAETPYTVAIVRLEEGVHFFGRIVPGDGAGVEIGSKVAVGFEEVGKRGKMPVFHLA